MDWCSGTADLSVGGSLQIHHVDRRHPVEVEPEAGDLHKMVTVQLETDGTGFP